MVRAVQDGAEMHERELRGKLKQIEGALRFARDALPAGAPRDEVMRALRNVEPLLEAGVIRVVRDAKSMTRLKIAWKTQYCNCPACGERVRSGSPFWSHYNSRHAKRPFWLDESDWPKLFSEPFHPPPEQ